MSSVDDPKLAHLQDMALDAGQRFDRLRMNIRDLAVLRHAKDIWLEAEEAVANQLRANPEA